MKLGRRDRSDFGKPEEGLGLTEAYTWIIILDLRGRAPDGWLAAVHLEENETSNRRRIRAGVGDR
jgi:hypothetical protein